MPRTNLIASRDAEQFFVTGRARNYGAKNVLLRLSKTERGWTQRVLTRDDYSGKCTVPLNVDYVSNEHPADLAQWLSLDVKDGLLHYSRQEAESFLDPTRAFWDEVVLVNEAAQPADTSTPA